MLDLYLKITLVTAVVYRPYLVTVSLNFIWCSSEFWKGAKVLFMKF